MAQQTAVEWLMQKIEKSLPNFMEAWREEFEQAKQMERKKKIEFAKHCLDKALDLDIRTAFFNVEEYYKQTYGKE